MKVSCINWQLFLRFLLLWSKLTLDFHHVTIAEADPRLMSFISSLIKLTPYQLTKQFCRRLITWTNHVLKKGTGMTDLKNTYGPEYMYTYKNCVWTETYAMPKNAGSIKIFHHLWSRVAWTEFFESVNVWAILSYSPW